LEPGEQITPTLRLVRPLGKGGMGAVWVADHLALGTQVAVKFMAAAYAQNAGLVQRFQREAVAAAQIKSPHVAQVFDHGVMASGEPYIVMELLEGEDLGQRVRRAGPLSVGELVPVVAQVAKALTRAHQLGIVHRDIKPDNVFLVSIDGELLVKILDFGIAKHAAEGLPGMTSTGAMLGTPLYMSPEQLLSSKAVDFRSDLWSLGVVGYHALTGRVPFAGETIGSISVAVHAGVYAPASSVRSGVSGAVDAWIARALCRDPAGRFGSARELAEALEQAAREPGGTAVLTSGLPVALGPTGTMATPTTPLPHTPVPVTPAPVATPAPVTPAPVTPAPSSGPMTMSDARTLVGTANTRAGDASRRVPVIAGVILLVAAVGAVGVLLLRRSQGEQRAPAATAAVMGVVTASSASASASAEALPAVIVDLDETPPASASASASAAPAGRPVGAAARPAGTVARGAPGAGAATAKPAAKRPDDIGF
jgi:serine/threonine-protein kinase